MDSENQKRVLIVAPSAYTLSGLATWLDYLEPGLTARGWDVTIGLLEGSEFHRPEAYLERHPHRQSVAIPCSTATPTGRVRALEKCLTDLKPDIAVAVNCPDLSYAVNRWRLRHSHPVRMVTTIHGFQPDLFDDLITSEAIVDAVVCTNRLTVRMTELLTSHEGERIFYAPYGVELTRSVPDLGWRDRDRLRLAYSGRLEEWQKRTSDLAEIANQLAIQSVPFELRVAGSGPDEQAFLDQLSPQATAQTQMLGFLKPEDLREKIYEHADVVVIPSLWETGPIVAWEAIAAGALVLSANFWGSQREGALLDGETALMFEIGDTETALRQLIDVWREPQIGEAIRRRAYAMVEARYSIPVSIDGWDRTMRSILEKSAKAPVSLEVPTRHKSRLDDLFGAEIGETLRSLFGRPTSAGGPGSEWPHSYSAKPLDDDSFWGKIAEQEQAAEAARV